MASRSEFQFWTGANGSPANTWKTAVNQTYNALVSLEIIDTLNNPKLARLSLNNAADEPFSATSAKQVGPFSPGQTDALSEFQYMRIFAPDTGNILFYGKIYRLDEEYNPVYGQLLKVRAYDNLKELVDFPTDDKDVAFPLVISNTGQFRSDVIKRIINDSTTPPHESTLAIPSSNLDLGGGTDIFSSSLKRVATNVGEGEIFINTGKKKALNALLSIASEDPHSSAANEDDFGFDFHASDKFNLAINSNTGNHTPAQYFNYFKRGSRPATLESNVANFKGLHLAYPTSSGEFAESGIKKFMLPEYSFERDGEEIYTEALINTSEKTKSDGGIQEARKHIRMELWQVVLTSSTPTFQWKGKAFDNREKADQAAGDVAEMLTFTYNSTNYGIGRIQYQNTTTQNATALILVSYEVGSRTQEYLNTYITGSSTLTVTGATSANTFTIVPSTGRLSQNFSLRRPYRMQRNVQSGADGLRRTVFNALQKGKEVAIRGNIRMLGTPYTYIDTYVASSSSASNATLNITPGDYGFTKGMTIAKINASGEVTDYGYATGVSTTTVIAKLDTGSWTGYTGETARVRLYIPIRAGHYMYATNQLQHIASYQFINEVMYSEGETMAVCNIQTQATQAAAPHGVKGLGVKPNSISSSIADSTAPIGAVTDTIAKAGLPWTLIPANATNRPVESIDYNTIRVNACVLSLGNGLYTYNLGTASTDVTTDHTIIYFDPDVSTTALQFAVKTAYTTNTEHIVLGWCKAIPSAVGAKAILHMGPNAIGVDPVVDGAFIKVASVDTAQIANDAITAAVLSPAAQPWTCNIRWRPHTTNGPVRVRWDNGTDNTNATLKFQDGSTVAIVEDNMDTDMNVSTTYYAYIDGLSGNQEMVFSSNYLDAMGTTKILLATITTGASNADGGSPVILPFNSKAPTINAVSIAADSITTNAIAANQVTAAKVATNTLTANEIAADAITTNELLIGAGTNAIGGLVANGDLDLGSIGSGNLSNIADGGGYEKATGTQLGYADRAGTGLNSSGRVSQPIGSGEGAKFFSYGQTSGTAVVIDNLGIKGASGLGGSFPNFTGGTTQFALSSVDGKATAGGGKIVLDASGVQVLAATNALSASSGIQFKYGSSLSNAQSQSVWVGLRLTQVDSGSTNGFTELEWEQTVTDTVAMSFNTMRLLEVGGITGATNATGIWRPPVSGGSAGEFLKISSGDGTIDSPYGTEWALPTNSIYSLVHTSHANNTYTAGTMLDLNGTTFSHEDTSSASSQNNSGSTFIQDITIDSRGHVTAMGTGTASGSGTITGNTVFTSNRGLYTTGGTEINDTAFYMNSTNVGDSGARAVMYGNTLDVNSTVILSGIGNVTGSGETTLHVSTAFGTVGVIRKGSSSQRYKENIATLVVDSSKVYDLTPKTFKWKDVTETINGATVNTTGVADFGLIAEEVNTVLPELVGLDAEDRPDAVSYQLLSVLLLEEMKVLKTRIIALENA